MKKSLIAIVFVCISMQCLFATDNRDRNSQRPHTRWSITLNLLKGVAYSLSGGYCAAHGNAIGTVIGISNGAENFLDAVHKDHENRQFDREHNEKTYNSYEPMEKEYDQGYDAYDNANR